MQGEGRGPGQRRLDTRPPLRPSTRKPACLPACRRACLPAPLTARLPACLPACLRDCLPSLVASSRACLRGARRPTRGLTPPLPYHPEPPTSPPPWGSLCATVVRRGPSAATGAIPLPLPRAGAGLRLPAAHPVVQRLTKKKAALCCVKDSRLLFAAQI